MFLNVYWRLLRMICVVYIILFYQPATNLFKQCVYVPRISICINTVDVQIIIRNPYV